MFNTFAKRLSANSLIVLILVFCVVISFRYAEGVEGENDYPKCPNYKKPIPGGNFQFCNCGIHTSVLPGVFHNFSILPDPVVMEWPNFNIMTNANVSLSETFGNHTELDLSLSIRLNRTDEPALELCDILPTDICFVPNVCEKVREQLHNITGCPVGKTDGPMPTPLIHIQEITSPPFLLKGKFVLQATLKEAGRQIACLQFEICFNDCIPIRKDEL